MLLNEKRLTVREHFRQPSPDDPLCPDCRARLVAKRGDVVVWHWAHERHAGESGCHHEESKWHLSMKAAYLNFNGWQVEVPVTANGKTYRADAMNPKTGAVREFVHSLSDHYVRKHFDLKRSGLDVLWIMDGEEFASLRSIRSRDGGIRRMLKPKALDLHRRIGTLVHYDGNLWHEWRNNVWYPNAGRAAKDVVMLFDKESEYQRNKREFGSLDLFGGPR